jgi:energy-converting hydrogenase Eha subunit A
VRIVRLFLGVALGYAAVMVTVVFLTTLVSLALGARFLDPDSVGAWSFSHSAVFLAIAVLSAWSGGFAAAWWGGGRVCGYVLAFLLLAIGEIALFTARANGTMGTTPLWIAAVAPIAGALSAIIGAHSKRAVGRSAVPSDRVSTQSP